MNKWKYCALLTASIAFVSALPCTSAQADVAFEQLPNLSGGQRISSTLDFFGQTPGFRTADDFSLASAGAINSITWWGSPLGGNDSFSFTFYANNAGIPGAVLGTSSIGPLTSESVPGAAFFTDIFSTTLLTSFNAQAGVTYWVSIFDANPTSRWLWSQGSNGPAVQMILDGTNVWSPLTTNMAFSFNTVPEPTSAGLLVLGMFRVLGARLRRR